MTDPSDPVDLSRLRAQLLALRADIVAAARPVDPPADESIRRSLENLGHYLALRAVDLRPLQDALCQRGLSSLGRCESNVLDSLDRLLDLLDKLVGEGEPARSERGIDQAWAARRLAANTEQLLGATPQGRDVRIMVTMPSEAATDPGFVRRLLELGMDVARINCAHDTPLHWLSMIEHLRREAAGMGRPIRISADLPGHKLRTGPLAMEPGVLHLSPQRDRYGKVVNPVRLAVSAEEGPSSGIAPGYARLMLRSEQGELLRPNEGDVLTFTDARGARRQAVVDLVEAGVSWLSLSKSSYLTNGLEWELGGHNRRLRGQFEGIEDEPVTLRLRRTDQLRLLASEEPGRPARIDADGQLREPACIGCKLPGLVSRLRVGQRVWLDDGKFGAVVVGLEPAAALLEITDCRPGGARLKSDKGINLPGLDLDLPPLSDEDIKALDALAGKVDIFNFSFVETADHIRGLQQALIERGVPETGIIAKIETARAFRNLAAIVQAGAASPPFGVMIARGDLAMEVGPERLVEVQEEILWLTEAAQLPVVWATQVLETLAKKGVISRPELTDAAMAERAECVMLNKGPFIEKAMQSLDDILRRMQAHQHKKTARLRALSWGRQAPVAAPVDTVS